VGSLLKFLLGYLFLSDFLKSVLFFIFDVELILIFPLVQVGLTLDTTSTGLHRDEIHHCSTTLGDDMASSKHLKEAV
jgi:hypothetical protein